LILLSAIWKYYIKRGIAKLSYKLYDQNLIVIRDSKILEIINKDIIKNIDIINEYGLQKVLHFYRKLKNYKNFF